jgi:8-oxo-dGTP pyrophosphatase MutT (NUDIX family)
MTDVDVELVSVLLELDTKKRLREGDVPFETWGEPGTATRPFGDFVIELAEGSTRLSESGPVVCTRISMCTAVMGKDEEGKDVQLYEAEQIFPDGTKKERNLPFVRESMQLPFKLMNVFGEGFEEAAQRGVREETGMEVDLEHFLVDLKPRWTPYYLSDTFPGLVTRRFEFNCRCELPQQLYVPTGYSSIQRGVTSIFRWGPPLEPDRHYYQ